jgi:hypothetical protein
LQYTNGFVYVFHDSRISLINTFGTTLDIVGTVCKCFCHRHRHHHHHRHHRHHHRHHIIVTLFCVKLLTLIAPILGLMTGSVYLPSGNFIIADSDGTIVCSHDDGDVDGDDDNGETTYIQILC